MVGLFKRKDKNANTATTSKGKSGSTGNVYYPYVNDPSAKTRILEIISLLVILAAVPAWMGGSVAFFVSLYALALGVWGLFSSWPRRHAVLTAILSLLMIAFLIVNIILAATNTGTCLPRYHPSFNTWDRQGHTFGINNFDNIIATSVFNVLHNISNDNLVANNNNTSNGTTFVNQDRWCGSRITVYITHGILIALFLPFFLLNILASREEREWEKGHHTARAGNTVVSSTPATRY
jgi:hypothetical protein